jgi:hypothetical protein
MKSFRLPLACLLLLACAPAFAGEQHEQHAQKAKHACPMHDATLTDAERAKAMDAMFAKLDADADGSVSRAEFDRHHEEMRSKHEGEDAHAH